MAINRLTKNDIEKSWKWALASASVDPTKAPKIQSNDDVEHVIEIPLQDGGVEVYRRDAGGTEDDWTLLTKV